MAHWWSVKPMSLGLVRLSPVLFSCSHFGSPSKTSFESIVIYWLKIRKSVRQSFINNSMELCPHKNKAEVIPAFLLAVLEYSQRLCL